MVVRSDSSSRIFCTSASVCRIAMLAGFCLAPGRSQILPLTRSLIVTKTCVSFGLERAIGLAEIVKSVQAARALGVVVAGALEIIDQGLERVVVGRFALHAGLNLEISDNHRVLLVVFQLVHHRMKFLEQAVV